MTTLHTLTSWKTKSGFSAACVAAGLLVLLGACDRPFVEPRVPEITFVAPDPDAIYIQRDVLLQIQASSFREISHLERNGKRLTFDEENEIWVDTVSLDPGINEIEVSAFDIENLEGRSTLTLTFLRPTLSDEAPSLPNPWRLGGHTTTLLNDGSLLVAGGSNAVDGDAVQQAFLLEAGADAFTLLENAMTHPRIGHTASLLPDGRVLLLGGSVTGDITSTSQLVQGVEVFDPVTRSFRQIVMEGTPIERSEHAMFVGLGANNRIIIDIFGGEGRIDQETTQTGLRRDFRTFILSSDTLVSLSAFGEFISDIQPGASVSAVQLTHPAPDEAGRYMITGTQFLESDQYDVNFTIDFNSAPVRIELLPRHRVPRTEHGGVLLQPGLIAFFGGFQRRNFSPLGSMEVYSEAAGDFFSLDHILQFRPRYGLTATILPSDRILLLGGFTENGRAINIAQYINWKALP